MKRITLLFWTVLIAILSACSNQGAESSSDDLSIDFEKYKLENGLTVVLHEDKSDPIVSVALMYHVGSNREVVGRTGFAHLFEHMLFQESENVPQDQFFKKIQNAGGTLNGFTWQDGTGYYEIVPKNALEMVLWLESDRMGYLINTVTEAAFANQQEVVQNEKRQRVDNRPYGHTGYVIDKNIFPEGHPYNWQVIGELVDLQSATVKDVKEFYKKFYGPNNVTVVIAGDFDNVDTKKLVEKYFGEIKKGPEVEPLVVQNVTLDKTKRLYHEDNFARAAQLNMVWPAAEQFNKDAYALDFLAELLSKGKKAPLYKVLVKDKNLTSRTTAWNNSMEIAGKFRINITANDGVKLDDIEEGIMEAFALFEKEGITDKDIERIKASQETDFYNGINSILSKSFQLAIYDVFAGDPNYVTQDINNIKAVTKDDVLRVYNKYIKGKPFVLTSFVPKGKTDLIASNSEKAKVVEEEVTENKGKKENKELNAVVKKTETSFDRSVEPAMGAQPKLNIPAQWNTTLDNNMKVFGIEQNELPLVEFNIILDGGMLLDNINKIGVANMMTDIMKEGTKNKTPQELEEEIELLGASIEMFTQKEYIVIKANTLARNFEKTLALLEEMLLEPRWDEEEFARIKTSTINTIKRRAGDPGTVTGNVYNKLLYGKDHILAYDTYGSEESVNSITIDDMKAYYNKNFSPSVARFHIVGNISQKRALSALENLNSKWKSKEVKFPEYTIPKQTENAKFYFVDFPGAKQSVINIGYLALAKTDPDHYAAQVMNYKLGGSFSGNINLILREEKGYTYGAYSSFGGSKSKGAFKASSSVRTNATFESVKIFKEEMEKYRNGINQDDMDFTKNAMIKSNARKFETYGSLLGVLQERSKYGFSENYVKERENIISKMTIDQHKALAQKYIHPDQMVYLVSGDAATQYEQFKSAGFDQVQLLDKDGNPVKEPVKVNMK